MAAQLPHLPGSERIRAIQDPDGQFTAFDSFPWAKDNTFMSGLYAILGDPSSDNPRGTPSELAIHARIFYYAQRVGVTIDFAQYKAWLAANPNHVPPDILPEAYKSSETAADSIPTWQSSAPKADLYVDKATTSAPSASQEGDGQASYPMSFQEILDRIKNGQPIPGIKDIPDTVVRDPAVRPVGARSAPRKPWEKDVAPNAGPDATQNNLDLSFPPLDDDESRPRA